MDRAFHLGAIIVAILLTSAAAVAGHDFEGQCESCHLSDPFEEKLIFVDNVDSLCRDCHDILGMNVHPSELTPSMKMPPGFWLDEEGQFNCATCHDPHPEEEQTNPSLLRSSASGTDFCLLCHDAAVSDDKRHLGAVAIAHHTGSDTAASPEGQLDAISADCVSCHDGSAAEGVKFCLLGQEGQCVSHVVGVDYSRSAAGNPSLHPPSELSPFITLYQGKVGCLSCHSIYSYNDHQLVISNQQSRLCTNCHKL